MGFNLPVDVDRRPIVIDGAGTMGRRIASMYVAGGSDVHIFDLSADQREAARTYVEQQIADVQQMVGLCLGACQALLCSYGGGQWSAKEDPTY